MMALLWGIIKNHLPASAIAVIVSALVAVLITQKVEIAHYKSDTQQARAEAEGLALSNAGLLASLREQNKAVSAMGKAQEAKKAAAAKAVKALQVHGSVITRQIQKIRNMPLTGDECAQLKTLLQQFGHP